MKTQEKIETRPVEARAASAPEVSRRSFLKGVFSTAALAAAASGAYIDASNALSEESEARKKAVEARFYKRADDLAG